MADKDLPEQRRQTKVPKVMDAQRGVFPLQSAHTEFSGFLRSDSRRRIWAWRAASLDTMFVRETRGGGLSNLSLLLIRR